MTKAKRDHRYSGPGSARFWARVNALTDDEERRAVYAGGVLLQNMEETVLAWLRNAETSQQAGQGTK